MRKNIHKLIITLVLVFVFTSLTGCAKCVNTEISTVQVKITDEYYRPMYLTPVLSGKTTIIVHQPAVYKITVEYNGFKYNISDSDTYNKYSNKVGEYVNGTLEIKEYDDGTIKYNIIALE